MTDHMNERRHQTSCDRARARPPEEPCAGKPHAGICEGDVGQLAFLP